MPREKLFKKGPEALTDDELAAILIGSGGRKRSVFEISKEVTAVLDDEMTGGGGLLIRESAPASKASRSRPAKGRDSSPDPSERSLSSGSGLREGPAGVLEGLLSIPGIGPAKASRIAAAFEFSRRRLETSRHRIRTAADVVPFVSFIAERKQENLVVISLNGANEVIATRVVTIGTVNASLVHPREVFADPITDRAAAVILAHNHPSGELNASVEDRRINERLSKAGNLLGIKVLDHIIVSPRGWRRMGGDDKMT